MSNDEMNKEDVRHICKVFDVPIRMVTCDPPITELEKKTVAQVDGHFCNDWDGLAVSAWTYEYDCCVDFNKTLRGRIINWFVMRNFHRVEQKTRKCERRKRLDALYIEKCRLSHKLYELRCTGDYMSERGDQEHAWTPGPARWAAYEEELAATRDLSRANQTAIEEEFEPIWEPKRKTKWNTL